MRLSTGTSLVTLSIALFAAASQAAAQDAAAVSTTTTTTTAAPADPGNEVIVTGSRSGTRTVANSPVPVDVISSSMIGQGGQAETNKVLNALVPSFNFPQPAIADGSDALRPATLRGLAPDQTLVLINGKRRHTSALLNINGTVGRGSAAVDMNTIPSLAIDRIEVLRDGASSQYGSDAIAGVINIRLKKAAEGGRITARYGAYDTSQDGVPEFGGLVLDAAGQPILNPTDTRYLLARTYSERDVHDGKSWSVAGNVGFAPFGADSYLNVTVEKRRRGQTNRQMVDLRPNYIRPSTTTFDPREITLDRYRFRFGDPKADDEIAFLNAGVPLGAAELYATVSYDKRISESAANYRQQNAAANRDFSTLAPNQSPTNANFVGLTPDGFLPLIGSTLVDHSETVGIRSDIAGWQADASIGYGHNKFDYDLSNTLNTSFGPASQRRFDAGGLRYGQLLANLDFSRDIAMGFAKPVALALGAEYREEQFKIRPGDFQSYAIGPYFRAAFATTAANCAAQTGVYNATTGVCSFPGRAAGAGAQGFPGIPASAQTDEKRHNVSLYAEADTDPIPGLSTTIAGRFENYSDFGSTVTGKIAARYEITPGLAVRGSLSNGFRAPSLHQQYFTTTSTNFISGVPVDISTVAVDSPLALALGSKPLRPEKSRNLSAGITAQPFSRLSFTADYYNIRINDRIVFTENLGAAGAGTAAVNAAVKAVLDANGYNSVGAARFFINGLNTRTQGVDVVATYRPALPEGYGKWNLTAAYNRNTNKILAYKNDLGALASIPNLVLFGRVESLRFTKGQPEDKVVLSADGDFDGLGVSFKTTRFGKVVSPGSASPLAPNQASLTAYGPDDIFLEPRWITDIEARLKLTSKWTVAVGSDNFFDVYPTRSPYGLRGAVGGVYPANQQYIPYSIFSPFGFNGRFVYARTSLDF